MDLHPPPVDVQRTVASDDAMVPAELATFVGLSTTSTVGLVCLPSAMRRCVIAFRGLTRNIIPSIAYPTRPFFTVAHGGNKAPRVRPAGPARGQEEA